jgi:hypothetical protein
MEGECLRFSFSFLLLLRKNVSLHLLAIGPGAKYLYTRGGQTSQYSSPMEIACPPLPAKVDSSVFQKAIVMTDGGGFFFFSIFFLLIF